MPSIVRAPDIGDNTMVDVRKAAVEPASFAAGTQPERKSNRNLQQRSRRSTPPPNVIPFTKPRGLANLAGITDPADVPAAVREARKLSRPNSEVGAIVNDQSRTTIAPKPQRPEPRQPKVDARQIADDQTRIRVDPTPASTMKMGSHGTPAPRAWPSATAQPIQTMQPSRPLPQQAPMQLPWSAFDQQPSVVVQPQTPAPAPRPVSTPLPMPVAPPAAVAPVYAPVYAPVAPPVAPPVAAPVAAPLAAPVRHADPHSLAIYDQMGLNQPSKVAKQAGKVIVSAYRLLGFSILTIIVVVLIGYITTTAFFYLSNSWVVPTAVSASDERVVTVAAQVAEQQNRRDLLADEVNQAERSIAMQQAFQGEFAKAIKSDLEGRKLALGRVRALASAAAGTRAYIASSNNAYASQSQNRMAQEYKAGLIDRSSMLSGKFQLAQITSSNLSLAERQAEFETKAEDLEQNAKSLDALLANAGNNSTALSYEVLKIKQEYEASRLDLAKSMEMRDTLKASLARQDKLLEALKQTAYYRAVNDKATVAMVPYTNLGKIKQGTALYGCRLGMLVCRHIGEVLTVLPGEVQFKHPHKDKEMRGQLVELKIDADETEAVEDDVLFVGSKPLFF